MLPPRVDAVAMLFWDSMGLEQVRLMRFKPQVPE